MANEQPIGGVGVACRVLSQCDFEEVLPELSFNGYGRVVAVRIVRVFQQGCGLI